MTNSLFPNPPAPAPCSEAIMLERGNKSTDASRAAFRAIQRLQYGINSIAEPTIGKWLEIPGHQEIMDEISWVTNDISRFDRLRQLGQNQRITAIACYWVRTFHPKLYEPLFAPLRGVRLKQFKTKHALWIVKPTDSLFLLWNLFTMDRMTEKDAADKLSKANQLDLWDQSIAAAVENKQLTRFTPRYPQHSLLALNFSHVPNIRPLLTARDFERGTK
jgi:hypothetical protein